MTDMKVLVEGAVKAGLDEAQTVIKSVKEEFSKTAEALKAKQADLDTETKKFGGEFGETKAKVAEITKEMADQAERLQKAVAAIDKLTAEMKAPRGAANDGSEIVKSRSGRIVPELTRKQHAIEFAKSRYFGESDSDSISPFNAAGVTDDHVAAYKAATDLFWGKVMRAPARAQMVEHVLTPDEIKTLDPLLIKKTISTISHGSRYWLTNEMYGEIISCYDEVTDLSRLFSQISISRGGLEVMKDNDVEKRALFRCELDCSPGRNPTPAVPGTVVIQTHEMYDFECITHTMLEDSEIDLESWLVPRVAEGFSRGRNEKFLWGTGTNEPEGLLRPGKHIEMPITPIAGSPAGHFTWQHLRIMPFQLAKKFQSQGSYMMARDALMSLFTMADGDGHPLIDRYLQIGADGVMRLWGYPIVQVDQLQNYLSTNTDVDGNLLPLVGSKPIGFGAWHAAYLVVDRKGFFVIRDPAYNPCGVTWHFGQRTGGGVLCENATCFLRVV